MSHLFSPCHISAFFEHSAVSPSDPFIIMVSTTSQKAKAYKASLFSKKQHKKRVAALMAATAAAVITHHMAPSLFPTPMNTSTLTGMGWLRELLAGHPVRFYDALGMPKHVFRKLVHELELHAGLKHSRHICAKEQVAIFLRICKTGCTIRNLRERFQRGPATISKCVHWHILYLEDKY